MPDSHAYERQRVCLVGWEIATRSTPVRGGGDALPRPCGDPAHARLLSWAHRGHGVLGASPCDQSGHRHRGLRRFPGRLRLRVPQRRPACRVEVLRPSSVLTTQPTTWSTAPTTATAAIPAGARCTVAPNMDRPSLGSPSSAAGLLPPKQLPSPLGPRCWQRRSQHQRQPGGLVCGAQRLCRLPLPGQKRHLPGQGPPKRQGGVGDLHGDRLTGRLAAATGAVVSRAPRPGVAFVKQVDLCLRLRASSWLWVAAAVSYLRRDRGTD
jgi:hypothetical protein